MGHTGFNRQIIRFLFSAFALGAIFSLFDLPNASAGQPLPSDRSDIVVPCAGALRAAQGSFTLDDFTSGGTGPSGKEIFEKCISVFGLCGDVYNGAPYKPGKLDVGTPYASQAANQEKDVAPAGGFTEEHIATRAGVIPTIVDRLIVQVGNRIQNFYRGYDTNLKFDSAASEKGIFDDLKASSMWRTKEEIDRFAKVGRNAYCTNIGACNSICGEGRPEKLTSVQIPNLPTQNPGAERMFLNYLPIPPPPGVPPCKSPSAFGICPIDPKDKPAVQESMKNWNAVVNSRFATMAAATVLDGDGVPFIADRLKQPEMVSFSGEGPLFTKEKTDLLKSGTLLNSVSGPTGCPDGVPFCGWPTTAAIYDDQISALCAEPAAGSASFTQRNDQVDFKSVAWDDGTFLAPGSHSQHCDMFFFQDYSKATVMSSLMTGAYAQATWVQLNEVIDEINTGTLSLTSENCQGLANTFFSQLKSAISTLDSAGNACGKTLPEIEAQCTSIENTQSECYEKALIGQIQVSGFNRIAECEVYSRAYSMFNQAFIVGPHLGAGSVMVSQLKNWATLGCVRVVAGSFTGIVSPAQALGLVESTINACFPFAYTALLNNYLNTVMLEVPTLKTGTAGKSKTFSLAKIQQGSWKSANLVKDGTPVTLMTGCHLVDQTPPPAPIRTDASPINASPQPTATPTSGGGS